jgi:hypothetical protein
LVAHVSGTTSSRRQSVRNPSKNTERLAVQEGGRWLGKSKASVNRRWEVGVTGILRGFAR